MDLNEWYNVLVALYVVAGLSYILSFGLGRSTLSRIVMTLWMIVILLYTANRPLDLGTDTIMYSNIFTMYKSGLPYEAIPVQQQINYFFFSLGQFSILFSDKFDIFLFIISAAFLLSTFISFKLIFRQSWHFPLFIFASTFIYYSFLFNLIRNSLIVGGVFWVLYLFFYNPTKWKRVLGLFVLLVLFLIHSSAGFIAVAILGASVLKTERQALFVWFAVLALSITGLDLFKIIQNLVYSLFPSSALAFKTGVYDQVNKVVGFRIDFVLYTILFGLIGYTISIKWKNPFYKSIVKWYLIQGSIFMLFFSFPYVDRIASLAWIGFPLLIGYPLVYWSGLRRYQFQISLATFIFGIANLILVARYDFHLALF
ncbi:EpsG family protein [Dyadobacter crusticola]|uniref:EpsG family protein n=1 Tax=Dyadobacter crusticola TaxID=292407 RepID=UPI0004E23EF9|nr:EpsG family protein [Dyadobacter crusticola]